MTADTLLNLLFNGGVAVSIGATVASLGMTYTIGELTLPLRRVQLVIVVVAVNALVLPAAAWGICEALPAQRRRSRPFRLARPDHHRHPA